MVGIPAHYPPNPRDIRPLPRLVEIHHSAAPPPLVFSSHSLLSRPVARRCSSSAATASASISIGGGGGQSSLPHRFEAAGREPDGDGVGGVGVEVDSGGGGSLRGGAAAGQAALVEEATATRGPLRYIGYDAYEVTCMLAALILQDDGIPITVHLSLDFFLCSFLFLVGFDRSEKIAALVKAANIKVEAYWPSLFAKLLEHRNVDDLILSVGSGKSPRPLIPS
uniref:Uncharacterized protein n=1 Tax=Oryza meridionalis TaxID=40149 RepID=A0A0E0CYT0_9ORYZ